MITIRVWTNYSRSADPPRLNVEEMELETYLRGVVPHEMSPSAPLEALKAQAVAARTFVLGTVPPFGAPRHSDIADVCTTNHCQVCSEETFPSADAAVLSTAGQYLKFEDHIAPAYYSGHCGGRTSTPAQAGWPGSAPWCQPVGCLCAPPRPPHHHGVGMCQDGAVLMAQRGLDYQTILHHYFTGVTLSIIGVDLPPSALGYDSQYILMAQSAGPDVWGTLSPYAMRFRVTCGFSHDDALRVHGDRHTITLIGSADQAWGVSQEMETFLCQVAPSNVSVERIAASSLDQLYARLHECIVQGDPFAYRR
jgi:hypothetical protein